MYGTKMGVLRGIGLPIEQAEEIALGYLEVVEQSEDYKEYRGGLSKLFGGATYEDLDKGDCIIFGTPERCAQRLKRAEADFGLTYPIFEVNFGGFPHQEAMKSLEMFAKYVMPQFK